MVKDINVTDKFVELMRKNAKLSKRIFTAALAATMAFAPAMAKAEGELPQDEIQLVAQESHKMTMEEYEAGVKNAYKELRKHLAEYDHMLQDVESAYYLVNYEYIGAELESELIAKGWINEVDMRDSEGAFTKANPDGWTNTDNFNSLKNKINKFNQETIHIDYINGEKDMEHLIDPSVLCYDEHDRKDTHHLFESWFNAYNLEKNSIMSNEAFEEATEQLLGNNAIDGEPDIYDASVGVRWLMLKVTGGDLMQFMRDYLDEHYWAKKGNKDIPDKRLEIYFVKDKLGKSQYYLNGTQVNRDCPDELEYIVANFGPYWNAVLDNVNNDMYSRLWMGEQSRDRAKEQAAAEEQQPVLQK